MRPTRAEIDLECIRHNARLIRKIIGPAVKFIAVVKANGYAHGAVKVSQTALAEGADALAVAIPEEGAELRAAGIKAPIFMLGLNPVDQAGLVVENDLTAAVCDKNDVRALAEAARAAGRTCKAMIKVDTGMFRIGIPAAEVDDLCQYMLDTSGIQLMGAFTHMANADTADKTYTVKQLEQFNAAVTKLSRKTPLTYIAAANSATVLYHPAGRFNAVRPGSILYGFQPSDELHNDYDFRLAMEFKTKVAYIKRVPPGSAIGYGSTYTTDRETFVATLPVGFADGYSRLLSNKADVLIGGKRRRIVGRVCMDQMMVDIGPVCDVAVGDEAVLLGRQGQESIALPDWAALTGDGFGDLLCRISARVPRVYLNE